MNSHQKIKRSNGNATEVKLAFTHLYAVDGFAYSAQILTRRRWATSICTLSPDTKASLSANQSSLEIVSTLRFATTSSSNKLPYRSLIMKIRTRLRRLLLFFRINKTHSLSSCPDLLIKMIAPSITRRAWTSRIHLRVKFSTNPSIIQQRLASKIQTLLVKVQSISSFRARNHMKSWVRNGFSPCSLKSPLFLKTLIL